MRKEFAQWATDRARRDAEFVFVTGDLGFNALESVREALGERFLNAGVAEQNMVSVAAGLAHSGLNVICYSIAPFTVFRPAEQIHVDACLNRKPVKIVGNGGGYGYGIMGATHHAIDDLAFLSSQQGLRCFVPYCGEQVAEMAEAMMQWPGPAYLRLGAGSHKGPVPESLRGFSRLRTGDRVTVVGIGPVVLPLFGAPDTDTFIAHSLPLEEIPDALLESVRHTRRLLIVEEHVSRGGLGENLALRLLQRADFPFAVRHHCAQGYPSGQYGSQNFHLKESQLDRDSLLAAVQGF